MNDIKIGDNLAYPEGLAQQEEHQTFNLGVTGSSPVSLINKEEKIYENKKERTKKPYKTCKPIT